MNNIFPATDTFLAAVVAGLQTGSDNHRKPGECN
jgi:hypothetical protein